MLTDKLETYTEWIKNAIEHTAVVPGVVEILGYRTESPGQIVVTYKFEDMEAWSRWNSYKEVQVVMKKLDEYTSNFTGEIWILSPIASKTIWPEI